MAYLTHVICICILYIYKLRKMADIIEELEEGSPYITIEKNIRK